MLSRLFGRALRLFFVYLAAGGGNVKTKRILIVQFKILLSKIIPAFVPTSLATLLGSELGEDKNMSNHSGSYMLNDVLKLLDQYAV